MANERDGEQFGKPAEINQDKQPPTDQQGQKPEFGQQGQKPEFGQQGQNPGGSQDQGWSGQADLGTETDTDTLTTDKDFATSQSPDGTGGERGGFVGSQGSGSSDYVQDEASAKPDFATQGQGALDNPDEDIETGQQRRDNDIEGGTGV